MEDVKNFGIYLLGMTSMLFMVLLMSLAVHAIFEFIGW
jgi:hypothetical protein